MRNLLLLVGLFCCQLGFGQNVDTLHFSVSGQIVDDIISHPIPNATVEIIEIIENDTFQKAIYTKTDDLGLYFIDSLSNNSCYTIKVSKKNCLPNISAVFCTNGEVESRKFKIDLELTPDTIIYVSCPPSPYNRKHKLPKPEFKSVHHLYFKPKSQKIQKDSLSFASIQTIQEIFKKYPNAKIEVEGHTDSRTSDKKSMKISIKRAKQVRKLLIKNGIPKKQISYKGYGEYNPTNDCVDEVPCSEEEYLRNNRVEFRITIPGNEKTIYSVSKHSSYFYHKDCKDCPF